MRRLAVYVRVVGVSGAFPVVYLVVACFHMASAKPRCSLFVERAVGPAQWCLSCVHAQTRFACKKLRKNLADRPESGRKRRFRPQQFAQRKCASSGLSTLRHPNHLEALSTAIAFPQSGRRLPALHKKLRHQQLTEWAEKKRKNRDVSFLGHAP